MINARNCAPSMGLARGDRVILIPSDMAAL
jgi:hypothetical protein